MSAVIDGVNEAAGEDVPVLIEGERGSGRELVARAIHDGGSRRAGRFVALRAASMSGAVLSSELEDRATGKLRRAQGGTLLLKEVSALPRGPQRLLTRTLRKRSREDEDHVDVRLIAATDSNLDAAADRDLFEPELAERLRSRTISVPPLRQRTADIPRLAAYFGARFTEALGRGRLQFSAQAMDLLISYSWPGNVAELKDVIRRLVLHSKRVRIEEADVTRHMPRPELRVPMEQLPFEEMVHAKLATFLARFRAGDTPEDLYGEVIGRVERPLIALVLERVGGNQLKAAKILGLNRNTLRKKINELGIDPRR